MSSKPGCRLGEMGSDVGGSLGQESKPGVTCGDPERSMSFPARWDLGNGRSIVGDSLSLLGDINMNLSME